MQVQISGKNIDIGDSLRSHISDRLEQNVTKYFDGNADGHVTVTREGHEFRAECVIHLSSGITLQSKGQSADAYACFDQASDRMEKRLRRYKRRLKDYHNRNAERGSGVEAPYYVIATPADEDDGDQDDLNPAIIAENTRRIDDLSVSDAVMRLDVSESPFLFFRNAKHGGLNVVYRRDDGNFGWIDPGA